MHPVHVEAVAGVVGRADILAGIFFLLSLICHQKYSVIETRERSPLLCDQQTNSNTKSKTSNQSYLPDECENNNNSAKPISHLYKNVYDKNGNENLSNDNMKDTSATLFHIQVNISCLIFKLYQT